MAIKKPQHLAKFYLKNGKCFLMIKEKFITNKVKMIGKDITRPEEMNFKIVVKGKTNETEKERLEKLYILLKPEDYYKKYEKMKRLSMVAIILFSCLTTKNVQPAN